MKPFVRILIGILVGVLATLLGVFLYGRVTGVRTAGAPDLPVGPAAVITHIAGPVFVIRGDETLNAEPGDRLEPGDVVKVTEGAVAQVQMADKGSALLGSDTLVRFMKLTGASQQLELRTEILTGSLSYKVEKLAGDESIVIEADGTEYEVRGTEFLIVKDENETLLAVSEGQVDVRGAAVDGGRASVGADQQLVMLPEGDPAIVEELSSGNRDRLAAARPMPIMPFGYADAPKPIRIEIVTDPPDSDIYIDGLKTGSGRFRSLLPEGTEIDVRVRRRGFLDYSVPVKADSDQYIEIRLDPANLQETLAEEKTDDPLLARLRADYERRLADLRSRFADRDAQDEAAQARIAAERAAREAEAVEAARREAEASAQLEMEKARRETLQAELSESRVENEKLRDLIQQIQELTD